MGGGRYLASASQDGTQEIGATSRGFCEHSNAADALQDYSSNSLGSQQKS